MLKKSDKIFIAGHNGLVGSAVLRKLKDYNYNNILTVEKSKLNLLDQPAVFKFLKKKKPKAVVICAAVVGGIKANNDFKAKFIYENLTMQNNLIHGSYLSKVKNLIFLGSSCVYPRNCKQPIKEEYLLSGILEKTNEPYAIAKIAGVKLCEAYNYQFKTNYKCLMPTNTYGPGDNYNLNTSHFLPAIIRKIHEAKLKGKKKITLWGTGRAKRELIYVNDLADAIIYFLGKKTKHYLINIGTGKEMSIKQHALKVSKIIKSNIKIEFDKKGLDGTPRKILDVSLAKKYGWKSSYTYEEGIVETYSNFKKFY